VDSTLKAVLGILDGADVEARCAALLVLTRIGADEDKVVGTVAALLAAPNVVVRDFALGYFEAVRPADGLAPLLPLLDSEDDAQRRRVVKILTEYGNSAVAAARKLLKEPPRRRLNAIIDLCASVRSGNALDVLFGFMAGDDFEANRSACDAIIATLPALNDKARADLFERAGKLAAQAKGHRSALVAAAKLFGALADERARRPLFAMLDAREPQVVRTHALAALVSSLRGQELSAKEIDALLPLLEGDDEAGVLRPVIRLLEDQNLDRQYLGPLNKLAESAQPSVKRFAVQKLGSFDSAGVVKTLIGYLTDDSYARRDQSAASLRNLPAARSALMKELLACEDERKAFTLTEVLLAHDRSWKRDVQDALWKRLENAIEKRDDRLHAPFFHFLDALDSAATSDRIRSRIEHLRKAKRWPESLRWLALIKDSPALDDEMRYARALSDLKAHRRKIGGILRRNDVALETFRMLATSTFPLVERLRRERVVDPDELYFVAFHLAEGRGEDRSVARELLEHLADKHGRTKVGKAARNKLRLLPASAA
jgi:hypothetical protein